MCHSENKNSHWPIISLSRFILIYDIMVIKVIYFAVPIQYIILLLPVDIIVGTIVGQIHPLFFCNIICELR